VIGTNKADGDLAAEQIRADTGQGREAGAQGRKAGRAALESLLTERQLRWVSFADWQRIDAAETAAAPEGAPRRKLVRIADMLAVLDQDAGPVTNT
jgi:ferredoxin--NADP+ reductase